MMPMTCQDAVAHRSTMKRKAHMRAAVVQGEHLAGIEDHENRPASRRNDFESVALQFVKGTDWDCGDRRAAFGCRCVQLLILLPVIAGYITAF
jgi:hypothetical protein